MQSLNWFQQHQIYWFWKECLSCVALALPVIRGIIIPSFFPLPGTEKYIGEYSECSRLLDCHANVACQICTALATLCGIYLYFLFQKCCKRDISTRIRVYIFVCMLHIFLGHVRTTPRGTSTVHCQPATATLDTAPARFWTDPAACLATVEPERLGFAKTNLHNFQTLSAHCSNALGLRPYLFGTLRRSHAIFFNL